LVAAAEGEVHKIAWPWHRERR